MHLLAQYPWAGNALKLERAVNYVKSFGPITEEAVKARYIALGGTVKAVIASDSPSDNAPADTVGEKAESALNTNTGAEPEKPAKKSKSKK